ncbi:MAG: exosortase W [Gammaproteobacteria bacterium]
MIDLSGKFPFILHVILYGIITTLFAYAYSETFVWLWHYWVKEQNWQFLVFVAFLYMLWDQQESIRQLQRNPSLPWGSVLLVVGCAILLAGQISGTQSLRELSLVVSIFGLVVLLFGPNYVRRLFWPLIYLILMTSLPSHLFEQLRTPLKLISAIVATDVLESAGYAIYREGTFLFLPHTTLEVADSCSGLNQLVSSIALGIPIAYTVLQSLWKRLFIIFLAVALGVVMNWVRVVLIAAWNYDSAKEIVHGPYGIYELPFIFLIGIFITFIVAITISRGEGSRLHESRHAGSSVSMVSVRRAGHFTSFFAAIVILLATSSYLYAWKAKPVYMEGGFSDFPLTMAGFHGEPIEKLDRPFYSGLAHNELIMKYTDSARETARVYVGYFHSQNQEEELIDYRYNWLHSGADTIELNLSPAPIRMKLRKVSGPSSKSKVIFSYDINGQNLIEPLEVKFASLVDALVWKRTNGAIIIIQFENASDALSEKEREFARQIVYEVQARLPGE